MDHRFQTRLDELTADAEINRSLLRGMVPRLQSFLQPFVASLQYDEQHQNARNYVQGLVSNLKDKTAEAIAYMHDQERQGLQKFIGQSSWNHKPLLQELVHQVAAEIGQPNGVLVFDPSSFPKKGTESVGVQRQWCGRLGKVENCQVGIYLAYVTPLEHALVDFRLYLPKEWTSDKKRMQKVGVPKEIKFQTRHELILEMLAERSSQLPHEWISGDDELGRCGWFRSELRSQKENYLLAVPSNTSIRDLLATPPASSGKGKKRKVPFTPVEAWCAALPETVWVTIEVRDAAKGPLVVQVAGTSVQAKTEGRVSQAVEQLLVFREQQGDGTYKHDYLLSNAEATTPREEFARVFKSQHRVEECLRRAKKEAGLADYQVRTWEGWHHHQTLSLIATWFLTQETRRGQKKTGPRL